MLPVPGHSLMHVLHHMGAWVTHAKVFQPAELLEVHKPIRESQIIPKEQMRKVASAAAGAMAHAFVLSWLFSQTA